MPQAHAQLTVRGRRFAWVALRRTWKLAGLCLGLVAGGLPGLGRSEDAGATEHAAPFTRLYSFGEIGCSAQGLQLLHDPFGRVVAAQQGELFVLDDSVWRKTRRAHVDDPNIGRVAAGPDGETLYGAFGSWGCFRLGEQGEWRPVSLVPADAPAWVRACNFCDILRTESGTFFWGQDGVVYRDRASGAHRYFPLVGVSWLFPLGGKHLVATFGIGTVALDLATGTATPVPDGGAELSSVIAAAGDGVSGLLLATLDRRLVRLREGRIERIHYGANDALPGPVTAMTALAEGGFAVAVSGFGLLLVDQDGTVRQLLDGADFRGITSLSSQEPGVFWAATERGVLKVLRHQPFMTVGREEGLPVYWPQVVWWRGRTIVSCSGRTYESFTNGPGDGIRFRVLAGQPEPIGWGLAALGDSLLIGNWDGVYETRGDGVFSQVFSGVNVARLTALDADTCLVIGAESIAVIRRAGGGWVECAPRIPGLGYPYVVHAGPGSAWIELGLNRVARIGLVGGALQLRVLDNFEGAEGSWVNVGVLGSTVALCATGRAPLFVDERTLERVEDPGLGDLVARSPYRPRRFAMDGTGTLWVSHLRGLFRARLKAGRYEPDFDTYRNFSEAMPLLQCPPGGGVWASTGTSLHRIDVAREGPGAGSVRPMLVGLRDTRSGAPVERGARAGDDLGVFRYAQNSLQLDFFAGSYALVRPQSYEYRLDESAWVGANVGSSVLLTDLREGAHALDVRVVDSLGPVGEVATYRLAVAPPWYRTWAAFVAYPLLAILGVYFAVRYAAFRNRVRLAELERQVDARTAQLRTAMECLREETTANATLAERNRLAGEIHDSLEQGFAGLVLQLETITRLPHCAGPVKAGLAAALTMVAYCRDELRNAVRGLHSPVLANEHLETALRRIVGQLAPLAGLASVRVEGTPRRIDPATEHHMLRIAQEALGNAVKHAEATRIVVVLRYAAEGLELSVADDGHGFDPAAVVESPGRHLGLPSFNERAAKIGGTVEIDTAPGRGTTIRVSVPDAGVAHVTS